MRGIFLCKHAFMRGPLFQRVLLHETQRKPLDSESVGNTTRITQWCRFLSQEVREISRFFVAPPTRVRPCPPRDISRAKFKFLLINLHHWVLNWTNRNFKMTMDTLMLSKMCKTEGSTQWCKFMSKNLNFAPEISRGGQGRTRVGGATKKREISRTSWLRNIHHWVC